MRHAEPLIVHNHTHPLPDELRAVLGPNWAICANTARNRARYTSCITEREYKLAIELALDRRNMDGAGI